MAKRLFFFPKKFPNLKQLLLKSILNLLPFILFFLIGTPVLANSEKNNKFGIHLAGASIKDLTDAAKLVNSSGGDWGYVTLVIQENDRNQKKWQTVFNEMRQLHLIPIVRIATSPQVDGFWKKPETREIDGWVDFLNSLNWVVKKRYLILFNEPNHGKEWGGRANPKEYGEIASRMAKKLKEKNKDFFVMLAGFDAAAPNKPPLYMDENIFLKTMDKTLPEGLTGLFNYIDGWASHSYPNRNFSGSPYNNGRNSIRNYLWELKLLKNLGVKKELPVFITETGWKINKKAGENFKIAFEQFWLKDKKVKAVTPFILNYQDRLFADFSWRKLNSQNFQPVYYQIRDLNKIKGNPEQINSFRIISLPPAKLLKLSAYQFPIKIKNKGQSIWNKKDGFELKIEGKKAENFKYFFSEIKDLKPFEEKTVYLNLETKDKSGRFDLKFVLSKNGRKIGTIGRWRLKIIPRANLQFSIGSFLGKKLTGNNFKFLIYDPEEKIVFSREKIAVKNGKGKIENIYNIAFGPKYRLVLLRPYFLPRQTFVIFNDNQNSKASFKYMWPLDFNQDGKFSLADFRAIFKILLTK